MKKVIILPDGTKKTVWVKSLKILIAILKIILAKIDKKLEKTKIDVSDLLGEEVDLLAIIDKSGNKKFAVSAIAETPDQTSVKIEESVMTNTVGESVNEVVGVDSDDKHEEFLQSSSID